MFATRVHLGLMGRFQATCSKKKKIYSLSAISSPEQPLFFDALSACVGLKRVAVATVLRHFVWSFMAARFTIRVKQVHIESVGSHLPTTADSASIET